MKERRERRAIPGAPGRGTKDIRVAGLPLQYLGIIEYDSN